MSKVFVFCIGGTGIRVMKSITMLMAGGMSTGGYTVVPIIVDPHLDLAEKKNLHQLIDSYEDIYKKTTNTGSDGRLNPLRVFFGSEILTLDELRGSQNNTYQFAGSQVQFKSYIGLSNLNAQDLNHYLVETMFSTKSLNNSLSVGFKGNPNVGTVVLGDMIAGANWFNSFKSLCAEGDRVFIISSIFGGTGASGYPLIEKQIRGANNQPTVQQVVMGAVTVLPYYSLTNPATTSSDIDSANFYTKAKAALAYYEGNVLSDYLYYCGEKELRPSYDNNEEKQDDEAHFIELVAASALFDFLKKGRPESPQYLTRAIDKDVDSLDLGSLGNGYSDIVKSVADYMLLKEFVEKLPKEKCFPLKKNRGFDSKFYTDDEFNKLKDFTAKYGAWYKELAGNKRAFAPLNCDGNNMGRWIKGRALDAEDYSYYLLEMIKASNKKESAEHSNKFRFFLQFAYEAIDNYTKKILNN